MVKNKQIIIRHPGIAAVLSTIFSGLGQIYNGQLAKGIILILFQLFNILILRKILIGYPIFLLVWIIGIADAYGGANKINKRLMNE